MQITSHGRACCRVDIATDAPEPVRYAADELVRFIAAKTGCRLPVGDGNGPAIVLRLADDGKKYRAALETNPKPESYAVEADEKNLYLIGADPLGLVYAVFDFLGREVDLGFAGLGALGVRVDFHPCLTVHVENRRCAPELAVRGLQGAICEDSIEAAGGVSPLHVRRLDWMVQNRMNYYLADPGIGYPGYPNRIKDFENIRELLPEIKRRGLKVQWGGHIWKRWVPAARYFEKHPEYFRMRDGKRVSPDDDSSQLCFCTSNPDVARIMADAILGVLDEFPSVDIVSVYPEDGAAMCECPACAAISPLPSGWSYDTLPGTDVNIPVSRHDRNKTVRYASFVNRVAHIVGKARPKVLLSASFYHDIDAPPEGVTLEPNIQPVLTHYWRCWRHPLDDPRCENAYYNRITQEWARLYPGRLVIYEYLMGLSGYVSLPWNVVPLMHREWKRYRDMGIAGATIQSQSSHFTVYGGNYAAFARMAWDVNRPTEDLALPYYYDLYGESAPPIIRMMHMLEERFHSEEFEPSDLEFLFTRMSTDEEEAVFRGHCRHCLYPTRETIVRIFDSRMVTEIEGCMREAHATAGCDRTRTNVAKLQAAVDYWNMAYEFCLRLGAARNLRSARSPDTVKVLRECVDWCDRIMHYLEQLPYDDVVARQMLLGIYWRLQRRALASRMDQPFDGTEGTIGHVGNWP